MTVLAAGWSDLVSLELSIWEHLARGTALYVGLLVLMRVMPRRAAGELEAMDLIFALLIAEAAAHAMGDYTSVADGFLLIVILMGWNYAVNALSYRWRFLERLLEARPLPIIRDGRLLWRNMRKEFLTEAELMSHLHKQGIDDLDAVKVAFVEGDGRISVIERKA
jgi:uncharacterized membrane protein YcaP (DUF421 family)